MKKLRLSQTEDHSKSHEARIHPERYFTHQDSVIAEDLDLYLPGAYIHRYSIDWHDINSNHLIGSLYCQFTPQDIGEHRYFANRWVSHTKRSYQMSLHPLGFPDFSEDETTDNLIKGFMQNRVDDYVLDHTDLFTSFSSEYETKQKINGMLNDVAMHLNDADPESIKDIAVEAALLSFNQQYDADIDKKVRVLFNQLFYKSIWEDTRRPSFTPEEADYFEPELNYSF